MQHNLECLDCLVLAVWLSRPLMHARKTNITLLVFLRLTLAKTRVAWVGNSKGLLHWLANEYAAPMYN